MQIASIMLNLGGDGGYQVPKYNVTPSEVHVLQLLHGNDAVNEIEIVGDVPRSAKAERERLLGVYAQVQPDGTRRSVVIDSLFPGVAARLYEKFDEMELDEIHFKTSDQKATERRVASRDPLDPDKKATPQSTEKTPAKAAEEGLDGLTKAKLVEYAKANEIEIDASASKADVLAAIKVAEEAKKGAPAEPVAEDDEDNDGIEDLNDGQGDSSIFDN